MILPLLLLTGKSFLSGVTKQISLDYVKKRETYRSLLSACMDFKKTGNRNCEIEYPIFTID